MTFRRTPEAREVTEWWKKCCLDWCYDRVEDGKFGDQKYLDDWPERFPNAVHVLTQMEKTLAPWNVRNFARLGGGTLSPVFYHFQSLRFVGPHKILLCRNYPLPSIAQYIYNEYVDALENACGLIKVKLGRAIPFASEKYAGMAWFWYLLGRLRGNIKYRNLSF